MSTETLKDVFVDNLKDLYSAETQLISALPKMAKAAESPELRKGFEKHLKETQGHVKRIVEICDDLGESPKGKKCKGMEGLIEEGSEIMEEMQEPSPARDAALIAAAQCVEHYEIARYGSVRTFAESLGQIHLVAILEKTLDEEKTTDEALTTLAESNVNAQAAMATGKDEEEEE